MSGNNRPKANSSLDQFYHDAIASIGELLKREGFSENSLEFRRYETAGFDRVAITIPASRKFSIALSYFPKAIEWRSCITIKPNYDPEFGYPCGPFLNLFRVDSRPRTWPIGDTDVNKRSLSQAEEALRRVGLPWLDRLKDPAFFADAVDKSNFDLYGAALEEAGRIDEAVVQYLLRIDNLERCLRIPRLPAAERLEFQEQIDMFKRRISSLSTK